MRKHIISIIAFCAVLGLASCGNIGRPDPTTITKVNGDKGAEKIDETPTEEEDDILFDEEELNDSISILVRDCMKDMTIEEKVGQLFFVRPDALEMGYSDTIINDDNLGGVIYVDKSMQRSLKDFPVGGVVMFEKNIVDGDQIKAFNAELQDASYIPMFIGVEEEGGEYAPVANNMNFDVTLYDSITKLGDRNESKLAEDVGKTISGYLKPYGFNIDLAPYCNIVDNDDGRKFSRSAEVTSRYVTAEIDGFHSNDMITAIKYFPAESSGGKVSLSWDRLMSNELLPFTRNLTSADIVMMSHAVTPGVTDDNMPASMSEQMIEDRLREELGFKGVVMTKSMADKSLSEKYTQGECAVNAIKAGADIIYTPFSLSESYNAVLTAVNKGEISEERLNQSVKRILRLKAEYGILTEVPEKEITEDNTSKAETTKK